MKRMKTMKNFSEDPRYFMFFMSFMVKRYGQCQWR